MSRRMDYTVTFDVPVERVYADFTSRTFWDSLMAAYGWLTPQSEVTHFSSSDSGTDIVFRQLLPRSELPPIARSVMPVDMVITREQHFDPFDAAQRRVTGSYRATVPRGPGHFGGQYLLTEGESGTQMRLASVCKVSIPLIGGTLEQLILSNITMLFDAERQFMADWVAQR
ncbi:DUF2505 domain-containing protein [Mycobacterium sp. ACS4331]|uniref:DUF2505 domain-containing protein n=1 Tax=Mycobacterium sp. ACS4331 TaxID=1834121 RepID=UPI0018D43BE6|nr:DUF2505 domain-containing protein [Mycobacterium sp. ACS4331]